MCPGGVRIKSLRRQKLRKLPLRRCELGIDPAQDRDARLAKDVGHFGFFETGSVVFESQTAVRLVDMEAAEAVRVGEQAEMAKLPGLKRGLQLVSDFDEGHDWGL